MTTSPDFDRRISAWMDDQAPMREPDGLLERVTAELEQTSRVPAWRLPERWIPMTLTARLSLSPPLRSTWTLLVVGLIALALVVSLALVGSQLLRENDPTRLNGGMLVPTLQVDETWDAGKIPGLDHPTGMDLAADGTLYVMNGGASEILALDPDGNVLRRWGEPGLGDGQFSLRPDPSNSASALGGVAVAPDGTVHAMDTMNHRVQRFDPNGTFLGSWGWFGSERGRFLMGSDLATGPDGSIYVMDQQRHDLQHFTAEGEYLGSIGSHGSGEGQFEDINGIWVAPDGTVIDSDWAGRVQLRDADGGLRTTIGSPGTGPGQFIHPGDVAMDAAGDLYVSEASRVQVFGPDLELLSVWEAPVSPSTVEGDWLALTSAPDGTLYVGVNRDSVILKLRIVDAPRDAPVAPATDDVASADASVRSPVPQATRTSRSSRAAPPFEVPFTVALAPGWVASAPQPGAWSASFNDNEADTHVYVNVQLPTNAFADPCDSGEGPIDPPIAMSVDAFVDVLTSAPSVRLTSPVTDVTVDGYPGKRFDLQAADNTGCHEAPWLEQWTFDAGGRQESRGLASGQHQRMTVLDVDGRIVLEEVWSFAGQTPAELLAQANQVADSIDFE